MRTEVKVVAILAFVLIVVGVWWFMFHSPQGSQVVTNESPTAAPCNVVVTEAKPGQGNAPSSVLPSGSASRPTSAPASAPYGAAVAAATPAAPAASDGGRWWERTPTPAPASAPTRVTAATPLAAATSKPSLADAGTSHSYKVKTGDTYWSIAKAEYGDGNLFALIEKANPKVPSNRLAAGLTITIPARPAAAAAAAPATPGVAAVAGAETASPAAEGTTGTDPTTGKRYYIVKKGDNGLWAIAQNTLGDGKLWTKIKAANEGLQESNLHPGQKLWLPQVAGTDVKPAAAKPAVAGSSANGTPSAGSAVSSAAPSTVSIPGLTPAAPAAVSSPATPATPAAHVPNGSGAPASTNLPGGKAFD